MVDRDVFMQDKTAITDKIKESPASVIPILLIVILICFTFAPIRTDVMINFLIGAVLVVIGIGPVSYTHLNRLNQAKKDFGAGSFLLGGGLL